MVNGKGPFNFVVDTGASHTVITNQTAQKLGIPNTEIGWCRSAPGRPAQGAGGAVTAQTTTLESTKVGDVEEEDIEVAIKELKSVIDGRDTSKIESKMEELNSLLNRLGEVAS